MNQVLALSEWISKAEFFDQKVRTCCLSGIDRSRRSQRLTVPLQSWKSLRSRKETMVERSSIWKMSCLVFRNSWKLEYFNLKTIGYFCESQLDYLVSELHFKSPLHSQPSRHTAASSRVVSSTVARSHTNISRRRGHCATRRHSRRTDPVNHDWAWSWARLGSCQIARHWSLELWEGRGESLRAQSPGEERSRVLGFAHRVNQP